MIRIPRLLCHAVVEPSLIFAALGLAGIALGSGARASVDDQIVVEVTANSLQVQHPDFDMAAQTMRCGRGIWPRLIGC
jgi:hypothetical protein